jgi:hypothetical protein
MQRHEQSCRPADPMPAPPVRPLSQEPRLPPSCLPRVRCPVSLAVTAVWYTRCPLIWVLQEHEPYALAVGARISYPVEDDASEPRDERQLHRHPRTRRPGERDGPRQGTGSRTPAGEHRDGEMGGAPAGRRALTRNVYFPSHCSSISRSDHRRNAAIGCSCLRIGCPPSWTARAAPWRIWPPPASRRRECSVRLITFYREW